MIPFFQKQDIFAANTFGYYHYRIPVIAVTNKGTILTFCEARKSRGDWSPSSLLLKRSLDDGKSWEEPFVIADSDEYCVNNPAVLIENSGDTIHLVYCINYGRAFYCNSTDEGATFSDPVEITNVFETYKDKINWNAIATGPGGAIQMKNGRFVVPCWLAYGKGHAHNPSVVSTIYSDDNGKTWNAGEIISNNEAKNIINVNETSVVQLTDGKIMLSMRHKGSSHKKAYALSENGFDNWTKPDLDEALYEPVCMSSMIRYTENGINKQTKNRILFSNPDSEKKKLFNNKKRRNLTIKLSYDETKSWEVSKLLDKGQSGYSCLAIAKNGDILCLYERGGRKKKFGSCYYLCLARFNLEWLSNGTDSLD